MKQKKIIYLLLVNTIINLFIFSKIKIILYRSLLRYKISYKASLGIFSFIIAENVEICTGAKIGCFVLLLDNKKIILRENAKIYRFVKVLGLNSFYLGKNAIIGVDTCVISRHKDRYNNNVVSGGRFIVGDKTIITNKHMFDVLGNILIKR
ncbi:MAG: hypothetical protein LBF97_05355, partial [Elusimicrobiota bacterium]|nr:hypothetical protein [Elusimicrobiota bacterium]